MNISNAKAIPLSLMGEGWGEGVPQDHTLRARKLRIAMTDAERKLWKILRSEAFADWKFRRQHPIGCYITDFACPEMLLIIEVDGGQHYKNVSDAKRTQWLESCGWNVIRFWNNEVLQNSNGVAEILLQHLQTLATHRGSKEFSLRKTQYSCLGHTLTRLPLPSALEDDLSHEGEVL